MGLAGSAGADPLRTFAPRPGRRHDGFDDAADASAASDRSSVLLKFLGQRAPLQARYGHLGDIGVPRNPNSMISAYGRAATDVPIVNSFDRHALRRLSVVTEEATGADAATEGSGLVISPATTSPDDFA
jgi:hypothetical protein